MIPFSGHKRSYLQLTIHNCALQFQKQLYLSMYFCDYVQFIHIRNLQIKYKNIFLIIENALSIKIHVHFIYNHLTFTLCFEKLCRGTTFTFSSNLCSSQVNFSHTF